MGYIERAETYEQMARKALREAGEKMDEGKLGAAAGRAKKAAEFLTRAGTDRYHADKAREAALSGAFQGEHVAGGES